MKAACGDEEFIKLWETHGSPSIIADILGIARQTVLARRSALESRRKIKLPTWNDQSTRSHIERRLDHPGCINIDLKDGIVLVFSDAHYWPNLISTAHKALLKFIDQFKPEVIICNGDAFDGGSISRFPRIGWDEKPTVIQELATVDERLGEIESISKGNLIWTLGNHDARYETFLASRVPEFQGVDGFALKDRYPRWKPTWSVCINPSEYIPAVIKHRWKGGIHATHNNTLNSGVHYITGHLHSLKVTPFTDLRGTRFGVDTGTLAYPDGPQFLDYTEDAPKSHRSGFAVLTFHKGKLLWPELVHVLDEQEGLVEFRGKVIKV